jgi:hypothetical protein
MIGFKAIVFHHPVVVYRIVNYGNALGWITAVYQLIRISHLLNLCPSGIIISQLPVGLTGNDKAKTESRIQIRVVCIVEAVILIVKG